MHPRTSLALFLALTVAMAPLTAGHTFNHQDRHEVCEVYVDPHTDTLGTSSPEADGHVHTHDASLAKTSNLHHHDPCKQLGMQYGEGKKPDGKLEVLTTILSDPAGAGKTDPWGADNFGPFREISLAEAALPDNDPSTVEVIIGDEAYRFAVSSLKEQTSVSIFKDNVLAGMGLKGDGSPANPYIIEGYFVRNVLELKDTSKCVVVRNNLVHSDGIRGPIVDPTKIVFLPDLWPTMQALHDAAVALIDEKTQLKSQLASQKAALETQKTELEQQKAAYAQEAAEWEAAWDAYESDYATFVQELDALTAQFEEYASKYASAPPPEESHMEALGDLDALVPDFEGYMPAAGDWVASNPPPTTAPEGWYGDDWAAYQAQYDQFQATITAYLDVYEPELKASMPDKEEHEAFQQEQASFLEDTYAPFQKQYNDFMAAYDGLVAAADAAITKAKADIKVYDQFVLDVAKYQYRYVSTELTMLYNNVDDLIQKLLDLLRVKPPVNNLNNRGQLILDWNGQCVHAYNNVVEDLRVNQNNDRTGYATGGVLEDNRFYTIGQIRHYDGIVKDNEIGNRNHLRSLIPGSGVTAPTDRSVNNDGANQGEFRNNLIYGQVDLDYHGHHHSAGFFAPESHYHGSDGSHAYMKNPDGSYMKFPDGSLVPHHDHGKRWTSVRFTDNVLINPKGVGLRYEDRDHRADDEKANSENMNELKRPHFHRTLIELEDNVLVAPLFLDIVNAEGTLLWSDTWTAPKTDLVGRITDALQHLGAQIVNTHPGRNDAWVDVEGNTQFLIGGGTAYRGIGLKQVDDLSFQDNRGFVLGSGFNAGMTFAQLRDFFAASGDQPTDQLWTTVTAWGGTKSAATGFYLQHLRDVHVTVCDNTFRGFTKGLQATAQVYDDSLIETPDCTNDWGSADPATQIAYTAYPPPPPSCTQDLSSLTDPTLAKYLVKPAYEVVDGSICPVVQKVPPPPLPPAVQSLL